MSPRAVGIGSGPDSRCGATDDALMNGQASALFGKTREMNGDLWCPFSLLMGVGGSVDDPKKVADESQNLPGLTVI